MQHVPDLILVHGQGVSRSIVVLINLFRFDSSVFALSTGFDIVLQHISGSTVIHNTFRGLLWLERLWGSNPVVSVLWVRLWPAMCFWFGFGQQCASGSHRVPGLLLIVFRIKVTSLI